MAKPTIRFKGFDDEWEQRKFGEIVEKYEDPIETPTEAPVPTVEISPTEAALEENTEETDWFNDFDNRDSEETDWFDDWNYDENGNKVN